MASDLASDAGRPGRMASGLVTGIGRPGRTAAPGRAPGTGRPDHMVSDLAPGAGRRPGCLDQARSAVYRMGRPDLPPSAGCRA